MGVYVDGWIEVALLSGEWHGAARTNWITLDGGRTAPILYEIYEVGEKLNPPSDLSDEVLNTFDDTYGNHVYVIHWQQIVLANWNEVSVDYLFMLDLMRLFVEFHSEDRVRLVCWSS